MYIAFSTMNPVVHNLWLAVEEAGVGFPRGKHCLHGDHEMADPTLPGTEHTPTVSKTWHDGFSCQHHVGC